MTGNKYETALAEVRSVLAEWMVQGERISSEFARGVLADKIVDRLVAKGVIQSTDPDDLGYRTGPLAPGRRVTGGLPVPPQPPNHMDGHSSVPTPGSVQRSEDADA
jgi:hypothetical protein